MNGVRFCQMIFMNLLIGSCHLSSTCWCSGLHLLVFEYCIPRISPTWSWYVILFIHSWIQFANILLRIFVSIFIIGISLVFFFLVVSLSLFNGNACLVEWIREYLLCFSFLEKIIENWYNFLLKCLWEFTSESICAWCFLFWMVITYWFNIFNRL